jgi:anion-transporting  ArsA/GET3 family ATPase
MQARVSPITFITGKGGVGKSTFAAAVAYARASRGIKTLLVELGDVSFYKDFFHLEAVDYKPREIASNLEVALWSGDAALREYALHILKVESLYKIFFENYVMRTFINIAPALHELAILGKITSGKRKVGPALNYQSIVVDAYATGHFEALLKAPRGMAEVIKHGPMAEQSRGIRDVLTDRNETEFIVVTLPEELPMTESRELASVIREETTQEPHLVGNKWIIDVDLRKEVAAAASKPVGESAYVRAIEKSLLRQARAETARGDGFRSFTTLPMIYELDAWKLLQALGSHLGEAR